MGIVHERNVRGFCESVFANIFLPNFHFLLLLIIYLRSIGLAGLNIVQRYDRAGAQQTSVSKSGLKLSSHNHARVEYSKLLKNDTIEQLQMGVSTIATALVHTAF